jgi:hypothetical protein
MKVLSFDIGIKNLAWCLTDCQPISSSISGECCWRILDWGVWDLRIDIKDEIFYPELCTAKTASGKICGRVPLFSDISGNSCIGAYCKTHATRCDTANTSDDIKKIPKLGITQLRELAEKMLISHTGLRKTELVSNIISKLKERYLFRIPTLKPSKTMSLDDIHDRILQRLTDIQCSADKILIENQPVKINATMKSVQMILWTTLRTRMLELNPDIKPNLSFINANKKLMVSPTFLTESPLSYKILSNTEAQESARDRTYSQRKDESVSRVKSILENTNQIEHLRWFEHNSKNDDLADCLLMCLYHQGCS